MEFRSEHSLLNRYVEFTNIFVQCIEFSGVSVCKIHFVYVKFVGSVTDSSGGRTQNSVHGICVIVLRGAIVVRTLELCMEFG